MLSYKQRLFCAKARTEVRAVFNIVVDLVLLPFRFLRKIRVSCSLCNQKKFSCQMYSQAGAPTARCKTCVYVNKSLAERAVF